MLTRRGYTVAGVAVVAFLLAAMHGARSLNAVVVPAVVALAAAVVQVRRLDPPAVERSLPGEAYVGGEASVDLRLRSDAPFTARVAERVPEGVAASGAVRETTVEDTTITYDVRFDERGEQSFGPLVVTAYDVLGLASHEFRYRGDDALLVYPWVKDLHGEARHALNLLPDVELERRREEFQGLREYEPGDPLRDVNWKASAKRADDDLIVTEFVAEEEEGRVAMAVGADDRAADAAATAAASVALYLLEAGIAVRLAAPNGVVESGVGDDQRERVLRLLARMPPGDPPEDDREAADLVVHGERNPADARVSVAGRELTFEQLVGGDVRPPTPAADDAGGFRSRVPGVSGVVR